MANKQFFGTDGIRGSVGQYPITAEFMLKLGWATGRVFGNGSAPKVVIGKDPRVSGYMFESAIESGLSAAGANSRLLGPMPTPAIAYLTRTLRAQVGIVISASHNSYQDNGVKFFSADGFKLSDEIEYAIEAELAKPFVTVASEKLGKVKRIVDAGGRYIEFCKSTIAQEVSLKGIKMVVDCAHGATYDVARRVFQELGAQVITIGAAPDGFNINAGFGATSPQALQKRVIAEQADLGIAFDGDGDRLVMVDHNGQLVDGDDILYLLMMSRLQMQHIKGGVVGTVMSNLGLEQAIQAQGLEFVRSKVGDRHVLAELQKRGWVLGGESSGHLINLDLTTTGDGIISALQVLRAMYRQQKSLADMVKPLQKFPQTMLNVRFAKHSEPLADPQVQQLIAHIDEQLGHSGRVLVRASGTEPVIRVMVEAEDKALTESKAQEIVHVIENL